MKHFEKVNRITVVGPNGIVIEDRNVSDVVIDVQDGERTLKLFFRKGNIKEDPPVQENLSLKACVKSRNFNHMLEIGSRMFRSGYSHEAVQKIIDHAVKDGNVYSLMKLWDELDKDPNCKEDCDITIKLLIDRCK